LTSRARHGYNSIATGIVRAKPEARHLNAPAIEATKVSKPDPVDSRSQGLYWASRGMSVGMEFALPALGGYWLDGRWPFRPVGVIAGAVLGFVIGLTHLLRIAAEGDRRFPRK